MDHENAPGNQGLLDQYMALKWIHNNIQYFGGDSSQITIFGESAGSVSVSLHLLSSLSSNLFRNAIMQSGAANADWAILENHDALQRNTDILKSFDCQNQTTEGLIECAKQMDPTTAIEKADEYFFTRANHGIAQFTFLPVVDNYFLEDEPIYLLNRGKFKKCPILLGANKDEGNYFFVYAFPEYRNFSTKPEIDYETFKDFLMSLFHFYPQYPSTSSNSILNAVAYRYTNWNNVHNTNSNFENLDRAAGDFHFLCPVVDFANIYAMNQQDVFFYHFTQHSSQHYWPEWLGVMHADEISFVFGEPIDPEMNFTINERILSRKMLKYWSNFVRYENPNGPSPLEHSLNSADLFASSGAYDISNSQLIKQGGITHTSKPNISLNHRINTQTLNQFIDTWPKYSIVSNSVEDYQRAYIVLNSEKVYVDYNLRAEYCTFWGSFLPNLVLRESKLAFPLTHTIICSLFFIFNLVFLFLSISSQSMRWCNKES